MRRALLPCLALLCGCSERSGQLAVVFHEGAQTLTSTVEGRYDFGSVPAGSQAQQLVVLKNTGTASLELLSVEQVSGEPVAIGQNGPFDSAFRFPGFGAGVKLAPSSVKGFELDLVAPKPGGRALTTQLRVHARTGSVEQTVLVTARVYDADGQCAVDPVMDFGAVPVGEKKDELLRVRNPSDLVLNAGVDALVGDPSFSGPDPAHFVMPPGSVRERTYTFTPRGVGDFSASVLVHPAEGCPPVGVTLRGTGISNWLTWAPDPVQFSLVPLGSQMTSTLTLSNWSNGNIHVSRLAADGDFSPAVTEVEVPAGHTSPSGPFAPGTAQVAIRFAPTRPGPQLGVLSFETDLGLQPTGLVGLRAEAGGPALQVTPASVDLGPVAYFAGALQPYGRATLELRNVGSAPLHLQQPWWQIRAGFNSSPADLCVGDFDPQLGCAHALSGYDAANGIAPGAVLEVPVTFTPSVGAAGGLAQSWDVDFTSDDVLHPVVTVPVTAQATVAPPCNFTLVSQSLDFGVVPPAPFADLELVISNNAGVPGDVCLVNGLELEAGSAPGFSLPSGPVLSATLDAQQSLRVPVRYTPQPGSLVARTGAITFSISSNVKPRVRVPLSAYDGSGCLTFDPPQVDLGTVALGCHSAAHTVTVMNTCAAPVTVLGAGFSGGSEFTDTAPLAPQTLAGGGTATFEVRYAPVNLGADHDAYAVQAMEGTLATSYRLAVTGQGDASGVETESHRQTVTGKADVLFMVDDSCSMAGLQAELQRGFADFVTQLDPRVDVHLGVVTSDMDDPSMQGRLQAAPGNPLVVSSRSSGFQQQFEGNVAVGTNGSGIEQYLPPVLAALTAPLSTGTNSGFLRDDARLSVVFVGDADVNPRDDLPAFLRQLWALKGWDTSAVDVSAVMPRVSCYAEPAVRGLPEEWLANSTNGVFADVCHLGWPAALDGLVSRALGSNRVFALVSTPDPAAISSITVTVDGVAVPSTAANGVAAWWYDATTNSVVFDPMYVPSAGQLVTFTYPVACFP